MQAHPNVTIKITVIENDPFKTKLNTAMQAGTPPDIFQSWGGGVLQQYAKAGLMKDITADLKSVAGATASAPPRSNLYSYNGKYYGVPWDVGAVGFWYNKDLFAKAGITAPPATWDDLLADIKKLKAAGITPIALGEKDKWPGAFYWEYLAVRLGGKAAFDKAYSAQGGAFTDPAFVQAGPYLQQLAALKPFENGFLGASYDDHQALMGNGKAAMELMGQWAPANDAAASADKKGKQLRLLPLPDAAERAGQPDRRARWRQRLRHRQERAAGSGRFRQVPDQRREPEGPGQDRRAPAPGQGRARARSPIRTCWRSRSSSRMRPYYQLYYDQFMSPAVGNDRERPDAGALRRERDTTGGGRGNRHRSKSGG